MIDYVDLFFAIALICVGVGVLVFTWWVSRIPDETIMNYVSTRSSSVKNRLWVKVLMMERKNRIERDGNN